MSLNPCIHRSNHSFYSRTRRGSYADKNINAFNFDIFTLDCFRRKFVQKAEKSFHFKRSRNIFVFGWGTTSSKTKDQAASLGCDSTLAAWYKKTTALKVQLL